MKKLSKAFKNSSPITLRFSNNELNGPDELMLTKTQIKKINKTMKKRVGSDSNISKTPIRKVVKQGGNLFSSLLSLGTKL